ncbi:MAG: crotonyl-CoA carboxylase/reductase [Leptospiraceae bacterium]|nr:crotonyl-CoA carboxylase/reductase [Leptospiraceae bacterium]
MDLQPIGSLPPLEKIPNKMYAQVIRSGYPGKFFLEIIDIPELKDDEVLIGIKAAGVNYNNVWAAHGIPIDVIKFLNKRGEKEDFHIGGSDASGIVYKVGNSAKGVSIGEEVILHAGFWDKSDPWIKEGGDPILSSTCRAWGYETNYGSFAQFAIAKDHQCLPKPKHLSWEESAVYMLSGATAYRMLTHWKPNNIKSGEYVLIWGGSGGLGVMAIQIARSLGAIPIVVVNDVEKIKFCKNLGAEEGLNRNNYSHWGVIDKDSIRGRSEWKKSYKKFESDLFEITNGSHPSIVIEHPGESTLPTSLQICKNGGMVVTCGGTSGYIGSFDLRHLWMFQKKIQGSHFASTEECNELNNLVINKKINPVLSGIYEFGKIEECIGLMKNNLHPFGSMAIRIA